MMSTATVATTQPAPPPAAGIVISATAGAEIARQRDKRGTPDAAIRVGIRGGGCTGFTYVFEWADELRPTVPDLAAYVRGQQSKVDAEMEAAADEYEPLATKFVALNREGRHAETKELVAGFWIWQVRSLDEAIEWARRCPNPMPGDSDLEIRPIFEAEDFGDALTPQLREQEEHLRQQVLAAKPHGA